MACHAGTIGKYDKRVLKLIRNGRIFLDKKTGTARSGKTGKKIGAVKRGVKGTTAYMKISLPIGKKTETGRRNYEWFPLHRAMALAYYGLPPEGCDRVNHIDGNGTNNRLKNLEWCSAKQNTQHAIAHGTFAQNGEANKMALLTEDDVRTIILSSKSDKALASIYGVGYKTIQTIRYGKNWKHVYAEVSQTPAFKEARVRFAQRSQMRKSKITSKQLKLVVQTLDTAPRVAAILGLPTYTVQRIRALPAWEWARKKYNAPETYSTKLQPAMVRKVYTAHGTHADIARRLGVSEDTAIKIRTGKSFTNITKELKRG